MNTHKKARKDATTDQAEPHHEPAFEQIQLRAYEIYIQRGRQDGLELDACELFSDELLVWETSRVLSP